MRRAGKYVGVGLMGFVGAGLLAESRSKTHMLFGWFGGSKSNPQPAEDARSTASYIWGNGIRTEKSEYLNTYPQYEPVKIETFDGKQQPHLHKLFFGPGVEGGIDAKGDLYLWTMLKQRSLDPEVVELFKKRDPVTKVASNVAKAGFINDACIMLKKDGSVEQLPIEWSTDADGEIAGYRLDSKKARKLEGVANVSDLSFGEEHVLALDRDGLVYCFGDDTLGQCGQGDKGRTTFGPFKEQKSDRFERIEGLGKVKTIVAGSNHSLAIDLEARVFGWGNNSFHQISHSEKYLQFNNPLMVSYSPLQITNNISDKKVVDAAAGRDFSIFVVEDAKGQTEVYGTGVNKFGQLGVGEFSDCSDMKKLPSLSNLQFQPDANAEVSQMKVEKISCGFDHCLCLTNMQILFEWGANAHGQLGNKRKNNSSHPLMLASFNDSRIVDLSCGQNSSSVIISIDQ